MKARREIGPAPPAPNAGTDFTSIPPRGRPDSTPPLPCGEGEGPAGFVAEAGPKPAAASSTASTSTMPAAPTNAAPAAAADALLLNREQAARRLNVSASTIKREVRAGRLRRTKIGRAARYSAAELRRYVLLRGAMTASLDEQAAARHADRKMSKSSR